VLTSLNPFENSRWRGMRVGLLGGSFNPPHEGHVHISLAALKGLRLDAVWWLVTPQNPLKGEKPLPLAERLRLCRSMLSHPRIVATDIEDQLGTNITYYSIRKLKTRFPATAFVWISGMDNAHNLHRWHHWQDLLGEICMLHLARNPARTLVQKCPSRLYASHRHVFIAKGGRFPLDSGLTYWMMQKKTVNVSSTEIRRKRIENQEAA
jgi:nicotinate-nucleotide adenylyltransferase